MKQSRRDLEVALLDRILGPANYHLSNPSGPNAELLALVKTEKKKFYYVIIKLGGYPEVYPSVYVKGELKNKRGEPMSTTDASMHCYGYENGNTKLCLGWTATWNPETHLVFLYLRAKIWLECYDRHLATGQKIEDFLRHA